jgi:plasmid stabilization system protein ParE
MAYTVNILDVAMDDIAERVDYLRNRWGDEVANKGYLELMDKMALLASQPRMGIVPDELSRLGIVNFRVLVHESHTKVMYEVAENTKSITVHMVFSSNQDFQTLLYRRIMRA